MKYTVSIRILSSMKSLFHVISHGTEDVFTWNHESHGTVYRVHEIHCTYGTEYYTVPWDTEFHEIHSTMGYRVP